MSSSKPDFEKALEFTLKWEGGYINHPNDPGAATKYGISLAEAVRDPQVNIDMDNDGDEDEEDIRLLPMSKAIEIYKTKYWNRYCLLVPFPLSICMFDSVILFNPVNPIRWLDVCKSTNNWRKFIELRTIYHLDRVKKNPSLSVFKKGWLNRVNDLKKYIEIITSTSS